MKYITISLILAIVTSSNAVPLHQFEKEWNGFLNIFKPVYNGSAELEYRKQIFLKNFEKIQKHNTEYDLGLHSYLKGVNQFTDKTNLEIKRQFTGLNIEARRNLNRENYLKLNLSNVIDVPDSIDWRELGAVTPVKDQRNCGSCWAFSAIGTIEGRYFLATNKSVSFSEQQLVSCSKHNGGCAGGWVVSAFKDLKKVAGVATEASYPYKAKNRRCRFTDEMAVAKVTGYHEIPGNEELLKKAVATYGPISIAMQVTHHFVNYKSGIFSDKTCSKNKYKVNHGLLLVGYGTKAGDDYWIVKNSWSRYWGNKGYIKIKRNAGNICSIASFASFPMIEPIRK